MTSRRLSVAVVACALTLLIPGLSLALPRSVQAYLLGPKMVQAEIGVVTADGVLHDFQLERGRVLKRSTGGTLVVAERNGTNGTITIAPTAHVLLNGNAATLRALRPGMQVLVSHDRDLPADAVYASRTAAPKLPMAISSLLLGGRMTRAEIALKDTVLHDYLLDHGRIKQAGPYTLALREPNGLVVAIDVSETARVKLNGQNASFAQLRKGMMATTMRDGNQPAEAVYATGR
jgi:hypothetical protein